MRRGRHRERLMSCAVSERAIGQAADLDVIAERVIHVDRVRSGGADVLDAQRFQFRLNARAVEIGDRIGHVIDTASAPSSEKTTLTKTASFHPDSSPLSPAPAPA